MFHAFPRSHVEIHTIPLRRTRPRDTHSERTTRSPTHAFPRSPVGMHTVPRRGTDPATPTRNFPKHPEPLVPTVHRGNAYRSAPRNRPGDTHPKHSPRTPSHSFPSSAWPEARQDGSKTRRTGSEGPPRAPHSSPRAPVAMHTAPLRGMDPAAGTRNLPHAPRFTLFPSSAWEKAHRSGSKMRRSLERAGPWVDAPTLEPTGEAC